jgi:hypothetical protein
LAKIPQQFSDSDGSLDISNKDTQIGPKDRIDFIVGYGDSTVFLHETLIGIRKGIVETIWDIQGCGKIT